VPGARAAVVRTTPGAASSWMSTSGSDRQLQANRTLCFSSCSAIRARPCFARSRAIRCSSIWPVSRAEPAALPAALRRTLHIDFPILDFTDVAAIILVSPNNPTFFCVSRGFRFVWLGWRRARRALIVDDVFADFPLSPSAEALTAVAGRASPALVLAGGLSKSCGLPHLKLGWIAARAARLGPRCTGAPGIDRRHVPVSGDAVQMALPDLLQAGADPSQILETRATQPQPWPKPWAGIRPARSCPQRLAGAPSCACRKIMSDEAWASALLEKTSVLVQPGYFFDLTMGATWCSASSWQESIFAEGVARCLARGRYLSPRWSSTTSASVMNHLDQGPLRRRAGNLQVHVARQQHGEHMSIRRIAIKQQLSIGRT